MSLAVPKLVAEARFRIREVPPRAFHARPQAGVLIDVREPAGWETGSIADAIDIPRAMPRFQVDTRRAAANAGTPALSREDRPRAAGCRAAGRDAFAIRSLQAIGRTDACSIAGSVSDWTAASLPPTMR